MRNGNFCLRLVLWCTFHRSYRTYEEWKLTFRFNAPIVFPGSYRTYEEWKRLPTWQITLRDISSYRTYEEWKQSDGTVTKYWKREFLPYLWGMETTLTITSHEMQRTSFLPYLWGMETDFLHATGLVQKYGSYRTYEEWKLAWYASICIIRHGSYRTYEEWKLKEIEYTLEVEDWFLPYLWGMETLTWIHFKWTKSSSSYRTYEEWKLSLQDSKPKQTIHVLTVPMRNGNCFSVPFR